MESFFKEIFNAIYKGPKQMIVVAFLILSFWYFYQFLSWDFLLATECSLIIAAIVWILYDIIKAKLSKPKNANYDFSSFNETMRKAKEAIENSNKIQR